MPKNKVQDAVFTAIMAIIMVYGMIVYNVALNTGGVSGETFLLALHELPIMCPIMSLIATMLFKGTHTFGTFIQTWGMNFPCAVLWQMFYCGPLVRLIFRLIFREKKSK